MTILLAFRIYLYGVLAGHLIWFLWVKSKVGVSNQDHYLAIWLWPAGIFYLLYLIWVGNKGNDL